MSVSRLPAVFLTLFLIALWLAASPLPGEITSDAEWSKFKSTIWKLLWGEDEDARIEAVRKLGEANYLKAVKVLIDVAKLPNPRLAPAEREKKELLDKIERIDRCVNKNKGMITIIEKNDRDRMIMRVNEINKHLQKEASVRREVIHGLGQTTNKEAIAWLCDKGLADKSPLVREIVVRALGHMTDPASLRALHEATGDKDPGVRTMAVDGLGRRHPKESLDTVAAALKDENWQVRAAAVAALGMYRDLKIVDPLIAALKTEIGRLRGDIDKALERLLGRSMGGDHDLWKSWWEANKAEILSGGSADEHGGPGGAGAMKTTSFYGIRTFSKNVMFIIDISGSMRHKGKIPEKEKRKGTGTVITGHKGGNGGPEPPIGPGPVNDTKMEIAKWELKKAIRGLEKGSLFNIIHYNSEVKPYSPNMVKVSKGQKVKVYRFIDGLQPVGMTNIHDALMKTFTMSGEGQRARKKNYKGSVDTIYFLTDGYATAGSVMEPDQILAAVREANRTRKIVIHTIGIYSVGDGQNRPDPNVRRWKRFLEQLAKQNGGRHKCFE
jgi:HEAT repeat protein